MQDELSVFKTRLGWCAILTGDKLLRALTFAHPSAGAAVGWLKIDDARPARQGSRNSALAERIRGVLSGEADDLRDVAIDLGHLTPFGRKVISGCRRISWGKTLSYGELAAISGWPGAARAVGSVMAKNRTPLVVPCHRVIGSGGRLGGYSAPQGLDLKRQLLAMEMGEKYVQKADTPILT